MPGVGGYESQVSGSGCDLGLGVTRTSTSQALGRHSKDRNGQKRARKDRNGPHKRKKLPEQDICTLNYIFSGTARAGKPSSGLFCLHIPRRTQRCAGNAAAPSACSRCGATAALAVSEVCLPVLLSRPSPAMLEPRRARRCPWKCCDVARRSIASHSVAMRNTTLHTRTLHYVSLYSILNYTTLSLHYTTLY